MLKEGKYQISQPNDGFKLIGYHANMVFLPTFIHLAVSGSHDEII